MGTKTLVNVIGAGRSGTTMLGAMLGRSSEAFYCGEVHAWFWPFRTHNRKLITEAGEDIWDVIKHYPPEKFHQCSAEHLKVSHLVDSSKSLSWVIKANQWAHDSDLACSNLLVWKDPVDLAYSHWKRGAPEDHWYRIFTRYYGNFLQLNLPFAAIRYSELAADPVGYLKQIEKLTGLPYEAGMERFWEAPASHVFGSLGTREQMRTGKPFSKTKLQEYPAEFERCRDALQHRLENDEKFQSLLAQLEQADLFGGADHLQRPYQLRRPIWYYEQRLRRKFREFFPHQSTTTQ